VATEIYYTQPQMMQALQCEYKSACKTVRKIEKGYPRWKVS